MPSANVHFRNLTAAHVDDDHGGCGQHSGPLRQGSPHVFVQNRPLVRQKDLPSCAGRPDHAPAPHCHVGEGGGSAITTMKRGGVQAAPRKKCTAAGHPVDVATGRVFTHVAERGSVALPELSWERFYSTEMAGESGPLGWGWTHSLMQRLEIGPDDLAYIDGEGRRVLFPRLDLGESVQHLDEQITLAQGNEGEYVLERPEGITLFFEAGPDDGVARLQAVIGEHGQFLALEYEAALLRRVSDSLGNVYRIDSEDGLHWSGISREASEEEPERTLTRFQYDRAGHLSAAADALGEWRRYGYDHAHRMVQETDRSGFSFFFEYDGQGRCRRTRGQDGVYDLSFAYAEGRTTQQDADGNTTEYEFNDLGLVTRVTDPDGHSEAFTYAGANQIARTDALGRTTAYAYDPEGRVTERTAPSGAASRMAYDGGGLASLAEPEGEPLTRTITPEGQTLVSAGAAPLLTLEADPDNGSIIAADGAGEKSRLHFDDAGRLIAAVSPLGRTLEASHDSFGSVSALRDTAGRTVRFEYDAEGRLSAVDREGGSGFRFGYDPEGNLEYFVDGNEGVTRFGTGGFHQLQSLTAPDGRTVRFEYDQANRLHRLSDARQSSWQMDYDRAGRLERLLHPEGGSETFGYDPAGQVRRHTARSGAGKDYDYDADGNLTQIRCDDGMALAFAYDKNGRVVSTSGPGSDVEFEYDGLGRLVRETQNGHSVAYAYDAAGRLSGMETPAGDKITYHYDADGALVGVTNWNGGRHRFVYGADGTLQSCQAPNGVGSRFEYSPLGLPTLVHLEREGEGAPLAQIRLRYGGDDALTEAADSALGRARFEYDPAGRLVRASGETREEFAYDPAGNLVRQGRQEYAYNAGNERVGSPDYACRHDADGNLTEEDTPEGTHRYAYNALGLLAVAEMPSGVRAEYAYDPFGRRTQKRVHQAGRGGRWTETRWVWAGDLLLCETVTNDAGAVLETRDFLFLPGSFTPLAQRVNGLVFCCHTDHRGAPTRLTDAEGQVAWAAAYSACGTAHPRKERLRQPLRLPGQYHDDETGLHQNRWRFFDPSTGRYLSPDPLGLLGGLNVYAYAEQDPINSADPLGLFPSINDLASHVLGAQSNAHAAKAYGQVQNLLHPHLSAATPPFMPLSPTPFGSSPFGPNGLGSLPFPTPLGAGLPASPPGLQGINGSLLPGHLLPGHLHPAKHHTPAQQAPPPARAAQSCTPKPLPAHRHTPRRAPLPSDTTPLLTTRDFFGGVGTGFRNLWDFRRGTEQASEDMVNPVKIYQGTQELGGQLATLVPGADGQKAAPGILARKLGSGFVESVNPFDKQNPYDIGYSAANVVSIIVPVAGEASALNDLRLGVKAATAEEGAARVAFASAKDPAEAAAASARLARAQKGVLKAREALKARLPGAGVRQRAAKAKAAKARMAARKAQERRSGGAEPPVRTPEQVAAAEQKFNSQKQDALDDARHQQLHRRQPALVGARPHSAEVARPSAAPSGNHTPAIGMPNNKPGMMQMAQRSGLNNPAKSPDLLERIKANRNLKTRPDVKPAHSIQVPYGGSNLSQKAIEYRKNWVHPKTGKKGYWKQGNVAVYEYRDGEEFRTYAVKSIPRRAGKVGLHSEPAGLLDLDKMGIKLDQITQVYTEREPCMSAGNYCGTLLGSELPNIPVTHSFEYGIDPNSQVAGNAALEEALKEVKRTSK